MLTIAPLQIDRAPGPGLRRGLATHRHNQLSSVYQQNAVRTQHPLGAYTKELWRCVELWFQLTAINGISKGSKISRGASALHIDTDPP
jgi:hypothetical protein